LWISCQKSAQPTIPTPALEKKSIQQSNASRSAISDIVAGDPTFQKMVYLCYPMMAKLSQTGGIPQPVEFNDGIIKFTECKTLSVKLGFGDSARFTSYESQMQTTGHAFVKKYPDLSRADIINAVSKFNEIHALYAFSPCQEAAEGDLIIGACGCSAFCIIPFAGEVMAGTCGVGVLMKYNGAMQACAAQ